MASVGGQLLVWAARAGVPMSSDMPTPFSEEKIQQLGLAGTQSVLKHQLQKHLLGKKLTVKNISKFYLCYPTHQIKINSIRLKIIEILNTFKLGYSKHLVITNKLSVCLVLVS